MDVGKTTLARQLLARHEGGGTIFDLERPEEELLARCDPILRQLLGAYRDIDTVPWALSDWAERHGVKPERVPWNVSAPPEGQSP